MGIQYPRPQVGNHFAVNNKKISYFRVVKKLAIKEYELSGSQPITTCRK